VHEETAAESVLRVGSAFPDPPFDVPGPEPTGLDVELTQAIARHLGRRWELHRYDGADFDGIFGELGRAFDVVASGATITDHRRTLARWCDPYVRSGQSLVVNVAKTPQVRSTQNLAGLVIGVQEGNTSEPVARELHETGRVADVKVYAYDEILTALDDLEAGRIGGFMKLEPVMRHLTAGRADLGIVQTGITKELIAMAVALDDADLAGQVNSAQRTLASNGELAAMGARWLAGSDPKATGVEL
jgi:polar amino acid transport system substrate-binding protein